MKAAVRYYSRSGNTRLVAEAIAKAAGVEAVSVDAAEAALCEPAEVLFIGGAVYAYGIDRRLQDYLRALPQGVARRAVVFSTSWVSRHAIDLIKKALTQKGVAVADETFYVKNKPSAEQLRQAGDFARKFL